MGYKIIIDSCGELPEEKKKDPHFELVPLELMIDDFRTWDDENFDQLDFIKRVAASKNCPKSACPSPERYMRAMETEDGTDVYVVTLSGALSGSYNSAMLARSMFLEEHPGRNVHVFDSCSASCGQTQIAFVAEQLAKQGLPFEEVVEKTAAYRDDMTTYFVLDNLDPLRKNGRLTGLKSIVASTLSIKPVLSSTPKGEIQQLGQAVGMKKGLIKMVEIIAKEKPDSASRSVMITHCNAPERAEQVRQLCEKLLGYSSVLVMNMAGVSTLYASDGGIIVTL
ncbi:MAG: DegV family protein [Lachnospiraceae bacterium]|nr:DegV family protein [Lachnospiraceae bacterium]MCR5337667.1 DegV family protein [Lachnospiraceae bacterium]